jgi:hypothetical protein
MDKHIVVYDPKNEYWEGGLVTQEQATQLGARGVITMPIAMELMKRSGVGGFHKRAWGSGVPIDVNVPAVHCPLTLFCAPEYNVLRLVARLQCNPAFVGKLREGEKLIGQIRLSQDTGQSTPFTAGLSGNTHPIAAGDLGAPDAQDGWFVRAQAHLAVPMEGHYGFGLYGAIAGVRVAWAAVSLASA